MHPEQALKHLEEDLSRLERAVEAQRTTDSRATSITISIAAVISLILVGFLLANFFYFRSEWTDEKFAKSLRTELEELNPVLLAELNTLGKDLVPVYVREGRKQFPEMAPRISRGMSKQLRQFNSDFMTDTHDRLNRTEERIRTQVRTLLFNTYPGLKSPGARARLEKNFNTITDNAVTCAIQEFQNRFMADVDSFQNTIRKLGVSRREEEMVDLQKKFIRLWLQLLDEEIMKL